MPRFDQTGPNGNGPKTGRGLGECSTFDKTIQCKDCGKDFIFTVEEQIFYSEKGFQNPIRCKKCRELKKASR